MTRLHGVATEVGVQVKLESMSALSRHLDEHGDLRGVAVIGLDLGPSVLLSDTDGLALDRLRSVSSDGAVYLGCRLGESDRLHIEATGGLIFPQLPDLPYQPYRAHLYRIDELMAGYAEGDESSRDRTVDARIWQWLQTRRDQLGTRLSMRDALAQRLHDHAMDDALSNLLEQDPAAPGKTRRVVAIMGGHALARTDAVYRDVVALGRLLSQQGLLVATGGGPGAMEAAHLGAWLRDQPEEAIDQALAMLAPAPCFRDPGWVDCADSVRKRWPAGAQVDSLAIPTWFYGHEPTNLFAVHIAKYFSNSLREDGLLAIATWGVVYAPGSAGTVQEIFMDAAQNHYGTFTLVSPMVFLGRDYWTHKRPVKDLLKGLAGQLQYAQLIAFVDGPQQAADFISEHPPVPYDDPAHSKGISE